MPDEIQESNSLTTDDILNELNAPDAESADSEIESEIEIPAEESTESTEDETEESEEVVEEEEEPEPKIEDIELEFHSIPKRAEILKQFPDLFKKFPGVEKAIYREQQYAEIFPTLDDAKDAQANNQRFINIEQDLLNGELAPLFQTLKKNAGDSYKKISDNILETLYQVDPESHNNVVHRIVKNTLAQAHKLGKEQKNDQIEIAAELLYDLIYKSKEVKAYDDENPKVSKVDEGAAKLQQERIKFAQQQLDTAVSDVGTRAQNIIKSTIDKNIDPKGSMSPYIRNKAIDDVFEAVNKEFKDDKQFQSVLNKLWKKAGEENYAEATKFKIRNALLAKARSTLPAIISKVRSEALKGSKTVVKKTEVRSNSSSTAAPKKSSASELKPGMTALDYLNS